MRVGRKITPPGSRRTGPPAVDTLSSIDLNPKQSKLEQEEA
jgi:hypothetical protein